MRDPEQVGPYRIIQRVSTGGAGVTYLGLAHDEAATGGQALLCCVKTPHAMWARDAAYLHAFKNEARLASLLDHPNIVRLRDVSLDASQPFLVYPFIEGLDLRELITSMRTRAEQLDWTLVVTIAYFVARALEHAHADQRGSSRLRQRPAVIHRDLCPSNIVIGVSGVVYLIDFGIARALEEATLAPSLHGSGRIAYAAPERLAEGRTYDARADLFSLGVVLFEALVGVPPYAADSIASHIKQVLSGPPRRLEPLRWEFRQGQERPPPRGLVQLVNIVHRLLEPHPDHRYPTATAVIDDLEQIETPNADYRALAAAAEHHMPAWRRDVRLCSAQDQGLSTLPNATHTGGRWSSTDPLHLAHLEQRARERDEIRVDHEAAERLLARRYTPLVVIRPELDDEALPTEPVAFEPVFDSTVPGGPTFELPSDEELDDCPTTPAPAPVKILIPPPFLVDEPVIPATRDSAPVYSEQELTAFASSRPPPPPSDRSIPTTGPVSSVPAPAGRASSSAKRSHVAADLPAYVLSPDGALTPVRLPCVPPPPAPRKHPARRWAVWGIGAAALAAVAALCGALVFTAVFRSTTAVEDTERTPQRRNPAAGGSRTPAQALTWLGEYPPVLIDVNGDGYRDAIGFSRSADGDDAITAVSGADASVLWVHEAEQDLSGQFDDVRVWVPSAARVVFADAGGNATGIDARTGAERWRATIGAQGTRACRIGPELLIATGDQYAHRVALDNGAMRRTRASNPPLCEHVPRVSENRLELSHPMPGWAQRHPPNLLWPREQVRGSWLSPTGDRYLVEVRHPGPTDRDIVEIAALRPDGGFMWQQPATEDWDVAQNWGLRHLTVEDGAVFATYDMVRARSDAPRRIAALDYETGARLWDAPLEWQTRQVDFVRADARRVYVGHRALEILDRADGHRVGRVGVFPNER